MVAQFGLGLVEPPLLDPDPAAKGGPKGFLEERYDCDAWPGNRRRERKMGGERYVAAALKHTATKRKNLTIVGSVLPTFLSPQPRWKRSMLVIPAG